MTSQKRKVILFFTGTMSGGGAERVVVEIINNLDRKKFAPALALFKKQGPYLPHIKRDIPIHELIGCSGGYKTVFRTRNKIIKLINKLKPNIVMSHLLGANIAVLRSTFNSKNMPPIIITEHNNLNQTLKKESNIFRQNLRKLEIRYLYRRATKVLAVSQGIKQEIVKNYGIHEDTISVIHNPVDITRIQGDRYKPSKKSEQRDDYQPKKIVAVGRLIKQKGFSDLINAFALVRKCIPAKLLILGEGVLRQDLEKQIQDLGLGQDVELPGFVNDPWAIIHNSNLFVMASHWEGLPLVLLEVMACGIPVIYTDCDYGPSEIINHGKDGLLVQVGDIKAISKAIIKVLNNDKLGNRLAENAKEKSKQFDSKIVTKKYENLFDSLAF